MPALIFQKLFSPPLLKLNRNLNTSIFLPFVQTDLASRQTSAESYGPTCLFLWSSFVPLASSILCHRLL